MRRTLESQGGSQTSGVREAYLDFLLRHVREGDSDFEALCHKHPQLKAHLRALHAHLSPLLRQYGPELSAPERSSSERAPRRARPERVGPYRIVAVLGEGAMGTVYRAIEAAPVRREVAVKVLKPGMNSAELVARFEGEREVLSLLDHPHVVALLGGGSTHDGHPYLAMELVVGPSITVHCDRRRLHLIDRLRLFARVCDGVQHAHARGVIHRDLKPSNILVVKRDREAVPKIIDFGISKAIRTRVTESPVLTRLGQVMGTPAYMSPEQAETQGINVDARSDVYSLGVLLYELLVGELPLDLDSLKAATYPEFQRLLLEHEPVRPSSRLRRLGSTRGVLARNRQTTSRSLWKQLRGDLDRIVMKAMAKDRSARYASAADLAADIQRFINRESVTPAA